MARPAARAVLLAILLLIGGAALVRLASDPRPISEESLPEAPRGARWIGNGPAIVPTIGVIGFASDEAPLLSPREVERTIRRLGAELAESPTDAAARSDLAAALLSRAVLTDGGVDLVRALEELERDGHGGSVQPATLYNRALVLTHSGLRGPAADAWEKYLEVDPASSWAQAARTRLRELGEPTLAERWEDGGRERLLRLARQGRLEDAAEALAAHPRFARKWLEETFIPQWAATAADAETDADGPHLETVRTLAGALAAATGDHTAADTLAPVDGRSLGDHRPLLDGLRLYGRAMAAYRAFAPEEEKEDLLRRSEEALRQAGAPLWRWARFYRTVGWHRTDPNFAHRRLAELAAMTPADRQPALLAHVEWMLGTNEVTSNRYERSLEHYRRARELLAQAEGPEAAAFIDLVIAEAHSKLGELDAAWATRNRAIRGVARLGEPQRLHAALYSAAEQLFLEHHEGAAAPYVEALVANAARWDTPIGLAEAALQEGRFRAHDGGTRAAEAAFRRAREAAARIEDGALRRRTEATIALYRAEAGVGENASSSLQALEQARADMIDLGYRFQLPRLDAARAAAHLVAGERPAAMAALRSSIAEEERIRRDVQDASTRASAFDGAQRAFDLLVELALEEPGGDARAFAWAERARGRVLLDLLNEDAAIALPREPVRLDELAAALPDHTDLVQYAVLPDRLVGWHVRRGESRRFETPVAARDLGPLVERFRDALELGADEAAVRDAGAALWNLLLAPVAEDLSPGRTLVIVPDRVLARVPFAALLDPNREAYLVEHHPLLVAPSATTYLAAREKLAPASAGPPTSILAVGANHPRQVPLPGVADEARAVGALYPRADVLTGADASRDRFLDSLGWAEVIHFAGHGEDDPAALTRARLFFQPAGADDSGILTSRELAATEITGTRLAVLAACRSVTPGRRGRENVSGLAAAFLAAGVPTVVASLWEADDDSTRAVMTAFHRHLRAGTAPPEALRRAQLELARSAPLHRSPRHWAGFVAVGSD